jgi:hypothetical protein
MASEAPGQPPGEAGPAEAEGERRRGEESERYGPLAVERHVKDDGRALILFAHAGEAEP